MSLQLSTKENIKKKRHMRIYPAHLEVQRHPNSTIGAKEMKKIPHPPKET
jgi:hypothetical protein